MKRKIFRRSFVMLSLIFMGSAVIGFWPNKLTGGYQLGGESLVDNPPETPQDTHFYIHLDGNSAQTLYNAMKVKAEHDEVLDDGSVTKQIGNMQCTKSKDGKTFDCYFSIDIKNQTIEVGASC